MNGTCPQCATVVADRAKVCPACKAPLTLEGRIMAWMDKILIAAIVAGVLVWMAVSRG